MRVSSTLVPRPTLLALLLPLTLLTSPHLHSADARAIDVSERYLSLEPHTPYADPSRSPSDSLSLNSQEMDSRSVKSSRTNGLFSMDMDIEGEDRDGDDEEDVDLDDYLEESTDGSTTPKDRAGRDIDPYRITIEPQYYSQDLFDYREEDDEVEENEGEDGFRSSGGDISLITRFREEIEEAFGEEDEDDDDEDDEMDMGDIDDEGDYVGFWHGDRRSSRSHRRRRQGLGLSLRGSTGGSSHGRQSWKINDHDWEEDLDGVLSLEDIFDRVQDLEHVHSEAKKSKEGAGGFRRLFPHNW